MLGAGLGLGVALVHPTTNAATNAISSRNER
jgi:hypothetical protein